VKGRRVGEEEEEEEEEEERIGRFDESEGDAMGLPCSFEV